MFHILISLALHSIAISFCFLSKKILYSHAHLPQLPPTTNTTNALPVDLYQTPIKIDSTILFWTMLCPQLPSSQLHFVTIQSISTWQRWSPPLSRNKRLIRFENDIYIIAKEIQNWSDQPLGAPRVEDMSFCKNFDCGAAIALMLWQMLSGHDLVPPGGQIIHVLWMLYFLN